MRPLDIQDVGTDLLQRAVGLELELAARPDIRRLIANTSGCR